MDRHRRQPTSDVINDWTNATYTGGNFFLGSNVNVLGVAQLGLTANTWTDTVPLTVTVGAAMNNLIAVYWTEGTVAQNVKLDASQRRLVAGNVAGPIAPREYGEELRRCQRYYWRVNSNGTNTYFCTGITSGTTLANGWVQKPVQSRTISGTLSSSGTPGDYRIWSPAGQVACSTNPPVLAHETDRSLAIQMQSTGLSDVQVCAVGFTGANGWVGVSWEL